MHSRSDSHVEPMQGLRTVSLCRWLEDIASIGSLYVTRHNARSTQHRRCGSRAASQNLRRSSWLSDTSRPIVGCHPDVFDVPSVTRKDEISSTLGERPDAQGRVASDCGEARVTWPETETTHGFSVCGPCRGASHVGLDRADDSRLLVCGPDALVKMISKLNVDLLRAMNTAFMELVSLRRTPGVH